MPADRRLDRMAGLWRSQRLVRRLSYFSSDWADLTIMLSILTVSALTMYLLVTNMRQGLLLARLELDQRVKIEKQLRHLSTHDSLTSIYNRAYFEDALMRLEYSQAYPITVIVADVDDLKRINDNRGHAVGDQILKCSAELLSAAVRSSDVLARIGGDEFAILLSKTDEVIAARLLQRFQENLSHYALEHPELPVQLSFGIATAMHGNLGETLRLADQRMYEHKSSQKSG